MPYPRRKPLMTKEEQEEMEKEPRIPRSRAAKLLGVTAQTLKSYPIPYRQYSTYAPAMYRISDIVAYREKHIYSPTNQQQ